MPPCSQRIGELAVQPSRPSDHTSLLRRSIERRATGSHSGAHASCADGAAVADLAGTNQRSSGTAGRDARSPGATAGTARGPFRRCASSIAIFFSAPITGSHLDAGRSDRVVQRTYRRRRRPVGLPRRSSSAIRVSARSMGRRLRQCSCANRPKQRMGWCVVVATVHRIRARG